MMTIQEMSKWTGVSARALRYYDKIGLFHPTAISEAGYRLYDEGALSVLQQILYFRELDIPLNTIKEIIENPALDRNHILRAQKSMLIAERERLERLICSIDDALKGAEAMDFTVFSREESTELFNALFEHIPEPMKEIAMKEFGSMEEWRAHYLNALESEKVQRQYAKVVEWFGGKEAYADAVRNPLSEEIRVSYKKRIDRILKELAEMKGLDVDCFEVRERIAEYGFVMKQLLQLKDEREMMLAQAQLYQQEPTKGMTDRQFGEGFSDFLHRAIERFYK
ncbi:MAG: MerR family transcriptional regulator [Clostridia bacterium]|nr:MerR family transcriptional regulator [Clostridia bacterium]